MNVKKEPKKLAAYTLSIEAIQAVQREARAIAVKRDTRVSASALMEELVQRYIIRKQGKKNGSK
jgi:hypothetical protein